MSDETGHLFKRPTVGPAGSSRTSPLASRMRPRTLDEFVGQEEILAAGSMLRRLIENDRLGSAIFYGPAGCGKTTLAFIIGEQSAAQFTTFSAVTSGVADVRQVVADAKRYRVESGLRTILFVDEIHRFNKAQQDAFLPHVEDGTIVLIGSTTENPFFYVNAPLVSRSRVFRFEPLTPAAIEVLVRRTLDDARGLAGVEVTLEPEALQHLCESSNGDARCALSALEAAVDAAQAENEARIVTLRLVEEGLQRVAITYDKSGDNHYDTISAFIKSMRGSDPDAAIYWLAKMLSAGEDPRFIARRLVIAAAEDVGNADPLALVIATAAARAAEQVGMPEAQIPLAQAVSYVAAAPKSNAANKAINRAMDEIADNGAKPVPIHLRDASYRGAKQLGHGDDYLYPHDFPDHFVAQEYLPTDAKGGPYYEPTDQGFEKKIAERMKERKKNQ